MLQRTHLDDVQGYVTDVVLMLVTITTPRWRWHQHDNRGLGDGNRRCDKDWVQEQVCVVVLSLSFDAQIGGFVWPRRRLCYSLSLSLSHKTFEVTVQDGVTNTTHSADQHGLKLYTKCRVLPSDIPGLLHRSTHITCPHA